MEEILPYAQSRITEQAKFPCSPLGKTFEIQTKTIEDHGIKQLEALKGFKTRRKPRTKIKSIERLFQKEMRTS